MGRGAMGRVGSWWLVSGVRDVGVGGVVWLAL